MKDIKYSHIADGVGYLYRASFSLAKGEVKQALSFLHIAESKIEEPVDVPHTSRELEEKPRYWAEKILDTYRIQMIKLSRV